MGADNVITNDQLTLDMESDPDNKPPETAPNEQFPNATLFKSVQDQIAEWLVVDTDNDYLLDIISATCISVELERPLFMMIQGASSSGKTKYLELLNNMPNFHKLHCLTPKTLFSGHSDSDGGYIPAVMGKKGILCIPDFTTVLSECRSHRNEIFSQLRIAYDGEGGRATGVDVKNIQARQWRGKIACIFAVTQKIEHFKKNASDLGERFLYYRHNAKVIDEDEMLAWSIRDSKPKISKLRSEIKQLITSGKKALHQRILEEDKRYIFTAAKFIAQMRAVVDRDNYSRQIELIHEPEQPFRLNEQLTGLYKCLLAIHGTESTRPKAALTKVIGSCIPELRLQIIKLLHLQPSMRTAEIASNLNLPDTTIRTCLEEMNAQQVLTKIAGKQYNADVWALNKHFTKLFKKVIR